MIGLSLFACGSRKDSYAQLIAHAISEHQDIENIRVVYLLDASCSACIGEFLGLIESLTKEALDQTLYVFYPDGFLDLIHYYLDQVQYVIPDNIILISRWDDFPFGYDAASRLILVDDNWQTLTLVQ